MNTYAQMALNMGKEIVEDQFRKEGRKLRQRDADDSGSDDVRGKLFEGIAAALDKLDLSNLENAKSLNSIGKMFEEFGKKLQKEAANLEDE